MQQQHHYQQLIDLFDSCFAEEFNTRLIKGDDEPIYLPADDETPYHRIVFAHGFFASALAIETLCCSPPESCAGKLSIRSSSPTSFNTALASSGFRQI